jgi:5-methylcytosine-specific restriction endonuclease McrA
VSPVVLGAGLKTWQNRASKLNSRARQAGVVGTVSATMLQQIVVAHGSACFHCGRPLSWKPVVGRPRSRTHGSFDHLTPLARGGAHAPFNLVPSCRGCNNERGCREFTFVRELEVA